ncbi:hypothetical protein [Mesorhizobium sp.]|nr:hypothetical protein [Mesorhizobium sp.]
MRQELRITDSNAVTIAFIEDSKRVVILRVFYGGADWQDDLA